MRKTVVWAGLCLALLIPGCKSQDQAIIEQTALVQETPAPRPAPVVPAPIVVVTDFAIAAGVDKAMTANGDTFRSARTIQVGETKKDVCGLPSVTFTAGDTYWSLCKAALKDPVATELAAEKAKRAELVRATDALAAEKAAAEAKWTQSYANWETSNAAVERLQARIDARSAAAPAANTPPPAAAATTAAATSAATVLPKTDAVAPVKEPNQTLWLIAAGIILAAIVIFVIWRFAGRSSKKSQKQADNPTDSTVSQRKQRGPSPLFDP